jgi:hypothetical protein
MRDWDLERQGTVYRGMVFAQAQEENVLAGVASTSGMARMILAQESDRERVGMVSNINKLVRTIASATVSYVGKANFGEAERYVRDFRLWTSPTAKGLCIEISAVNGRFTFDFLQSFTSPVFVNAFLKELEGNGITYDLQDVSKNPPAMPGDFYFIARGRNVPCWISGSDSMLGRAASRTTRKSITETLRFMYMDRLKWEYYILTNETVLKEVRACVWTSFQ